eukprot:scaffold5799_cov110-Cylindrotheca_fusiformis.AAC.4
MMHCRKSVRSVMVQRYHCPLRANVPNRTLPLLLWELATKQATDLGRLCPSRHYYPARTGISLIAA